jgi:hypothetical protein
MESSGDANMMVQLFLVAIECRTLYLFSINVLSEWRDTSLERGCFFSRKWKVSDEKIQAGSSN